MARNKTLDCEEASVDVLGSLAHPYHAGADDGGHLHPFFGGLTYGTMVSLGWQPLIGRTEISLQAYHNILFSPEYADVFWQGLILSIWVSVGSTVISAILALMTALLLRRTFVGKRVAPFYIN